MSDTVHGSLVERLVAAWTGPPADDADALAVFGDLYTDPVTINGTEMSVADLVDRARQLNRAIADLTTDVIDAVEADGRAAFVLRQSGRHVGTLSTPIGDLEPTGRRLETIGVDVFTLVGGKINSIWVVHDELGRLARIGAVELVRPA